MNNWTRDRYLAEVDRYRKDHFWFKTQEFEHEGHRFITQLGCGNKSIQIICKTCDSFQLAFAPSEVESMIIDHINLDSGVTSRDILEMLAKNENA